MFKGPIRTVVPEYAQIIKQAWDLYEYEHTSSAYFLARQNDNQFGYVSTGLLATTGSNTFTGVQTINGDLFVNGTINVSNIVSASVIFKSGSTIFGNTSDDRHEFTGSIYLSDSLYFQTGSTQTSVIAGQLTWNDTDGTLDLGLKGGRTTLQIGQEQVARVVNKTGGNLLESQYKVVSIQSATGQRLSVNLAIGNSEAGSFDTLGIVTEDIAVNQEGYITTYGLVREINTTGALQGETWNDGDLLFLSPFVSGSLTKVKPDAPNHGVRMGYVVYSHAIHGTIWVKVDNGYELDELHNVKIQNDTTGDILYKSGSVWTNTSLVHVVNNNVSTLVLNQVSSSLNFANDTAAAAGGIPLGGIYRNGNVIQIRIV
jgi:hypothetical protein